MENRVAMLSIVVEQKEAAGKINRILSEYADYIIGRMGIPYKEREISLISIALDGPQDEINSLTGKLGNINGVKAKALYAKI